MDAGSGSEASMEAEMQHRTLRIPLTVEVMLRETTSIAPQVIHEKVHDMLSSRTIEYIDGPIPLDPADHPFLASHVQRISLCDTDFDSTFLPRTRLMAWQVELSIHVFQPSSEGPLDAEAEGEEASSSYCEWELPAVAFCGLWESLIYNQDIKQRLLQYACTSIFFGHQGVDPHLVSFNRTVLLHGPPGTGKTSLCKALAQKLAIKFSDRFSNSQLIEVNAHSLFSKWFSESGKLVTALFARIREAVEEEDTLVFVLVDEVESLTAARKAAVSGSEPADAVRAVNALLTALDSLKGFPNVMLLTTSNITEAIDAAFVDRADLKIYLGPPNLQARYEILRTCTVELQRAGIICPDSQMPPKFQDLNPAYADTNVGWRSADTPCSGDSKSCDQEQRAGQKLMLVSSACEGVSGRFLRKLPFLAHMALGGGKGRGVTEKVPLEAYLKAMLDAVNHESADKKQMLQL